MNGLQPGGYSCSSRNAAPTWSGFGGTWMLASLSAGHARPFSGQLWVSHMTMLTHGAIESWYVHTGPLYEPFGGLVGSVGSVIRYDMALPDPGVLDRN